MFVLKLISLIGCSALLNDLQGFFLAMEGTNLHGNALKNLIVAEEILDFFQDERGEVFPQGMKRGKRMDVLTGCPKPQGIGMVLRTMSPEWIAVDEITGDTDCLALRNAAGCGVRFLATAHASSRQDLYHRPIYRSLTEIGLFEDLCILKPDKTFHLERM